MFYRPAYFLRPVRAERCRLQSHTPSIRSVVHRSEFPHREKRADRVHRTLRLERNRSPSARARKFVVDRVIKIHTAGVNAKCERLQIGFANRNVKIFQRVTVTSIFALMQS